MKKVETIFAYPTESFYALGVDARDKKAVQQLFRLKRREKNKPVALIAGDLKQVRKFFVMSSTEQQLVKKYWPGALTLLLRPKKQIAVSALLGLTTPTSLLARRRGQVKVGVRVPGHDGARRLAKKIGAPITATSANLSGQPPTKSVRKLKKDFPDILVMSGRCGKSLRPSTVVEIIKNKIIILRQGAVHPVRSS